MVSTKLLRLPTRGALGNGLRVVAGAVLASDGSLVVITRNRRIELRPERDGTTTVVSAKPVKLPIGTRIEISFGPALPRDARRSVLGDDRLPCWRGTGQTYAGKSSPWWYDAAAVPRAAVRQRQHAGARAGRPSRRLHRRQGRRDRRRRRGSAARSARTSPASRPTKLLEAARENAKPVTPERLGAVGPEAFSDYAYACRVGSRSVRLGRAATPKSRSWSRRGPRRRTRTDTDLIVCVNRTPVTGDIDAARDKRDIDVFGCGLRHTIAQGTEGRALRHLAQHHDALHADHVGRQGAGPEAVPRRDRERRRQGGAGRRTARAPASGSRRRTSCSTISTTVIADVSGDGEYRFNERQLFYALRPIVMDETGEELKIGNFTSIITDYESRARRDRGHVPRAARHRSTIRTATRRSRSAR